MNRFEWATVRGLTTFRGVVLRSPDPVINGMYMGRSMREAWAALAEWNQRRKERGFSPIIVVSADGPELYRRAADACARSGE